MTNHTNAVANVTMIFTAVYRHSLPMAGCLWHRCVFAIRHCMPCIDHECRSVKFKGVVYLTQRAGSFPPATGLPDAIPAHLHRCSRRHRLSLTTLRASARTTSLGAGIPQRRVPPPHASQTPNILIISFTTIPRTSTNPKSQHPPCYRPNVRAGRGRPRTLERPPARAGDRQGTAED